MKILLINHDEPLREAMESFFNGHKCEYLSYSNSHKATDNLVEISPEVILFNAGDFPRHWKLALRSYRETHAHKEGVFILLIPGDFPREEAMKASWLGANGLVNQNQILAKDFSALHSVINRYHYLEPRKEADQPHPPGELVFLTPEKNKLCSGKILWETSSRARFFPGDLGSILHISEGQTIDDASVKLGDEILSMDFTVLGNPGHLILQAETSQVLAG